MKLIINTDLGVQSMQNALWELYDLFVNMVVQNPNWDVDDSIEMPDFTTAVDALLNQYNNSDSN